MESKPLKDLFLQPFSISWLMIKLSWTFSPLIQFEMLKSLVWFNFFASPLVLGKLNTSDVIQRQNPNVCLSPFWCATYNRNGESAELQIICFCIVTRLFSCGIDYFRQPVLVGWLQLPAILCFQSSSYFWKMWKS